MGRRFSRSAPHISARVLWAPATLTCCWLKVTVSTSVRAAREQCDQQNQIPWREQQLVGLNFGRLGRASDEAQAVALHESVQMLDADSGEVHDLFMSEYFLARFYGYHRLLFLTGQTASTLQTSRRAAPQGKGQLPWL